MMTQMGKTSFRFKLRKCQEKLIYTVRVKCQEKFELRCYYPSTASYDRLTLNSGYGVCSLLKNLRIWYTVRVKCRTAIKASFISWKQQSRYKYIFWGSNHPIWWWTILCVVKSTGINCAPLNADMFCIPTNSTLFKGS